MTAPLPLVLADTREQTPLAPFVYRDRARVLLPVRRATLATGDYSLPGLDDPDKGPAVAVERKSIADLWGTLFGERTDALGERAASLDRFRAELARLRAFAWARVVVEGSVASLARYAEERAGRGGRREAADNFRSALAILRSLEVDFGAAVEWTESREGAEAFVGATLARIWEQHTGGPAYRKAVERGVAAALPWARAEPTDAAREAMAEAALVVESRRASEAAEGPQAPAAGARIRQAPSRVGQGKHRPTEGPRARGWEFNGG